MPSEVSGSSSLGVASWMNTASMMSSFSNSDVTMPSTMTSWPTMGLAEPLPWTVEIAVSSGGAVTVTVVVSVPVASSSSVAV